MSKFEYTSTFDKVLNRDLKTEGDEVLAKPLKRNSVVVEPTSLNKEVSRKSFLKRRSTIIVNSKDPISTLRRSTLRQSTLRRSSILRKSPVQSLKKKKS